MATELLQA